MRKIFGKVLEGLKTGRRIGYPTINILAGEIDIDFGVYACEVSVDGNVYKGAMHFGPKRIVHISKPVLEIYLLNFKGDLYGREVTIKVYRKIRDTIDFENFKSLRKQIECDVEAVKKFFNNVR
jgi:riboflavin kinase/FMN adenylyltransferase